MLHPLKKILMKEKETIKQSERSLYRSSFGATLLFSGVQIYQIIIKIIKSKFVALFIGPAGMGISSLLYSTTDTISAATNLGLNTSSVKSIAAANRDGNNEIISKTITALRRLVWLTGILGMLICAFLAPLWSKASFGNSDYIWSFIFVSVIILLDQLNRGELALLQGLQQKRMLAKANVIGQTLNALITIPLYYFYGIDAIVSALVLGSLISVSISTYYSHKLKVPRCSMSFRETFTIGREMIKLGFFLSLQFLMANVVIWVVRNYVSNTGGIDDVGLYSAGTAIVGSYIGLVFTAIATDYYPRLAATKTNEEMNTSVHTQAELMILLFAPLVVAFILFSKPVIILLYSAKFLPIEHMLYWSVGAVQLQSMGWALSHTLLAKAKPSVFFINELIATVWGLPIKILCYKYWGLTGFGMATMICYAVYLVQVLVVTKRLFNLSYELSIWKLFFILHIPVIAIVVVKLTMQEMFGYVMGSALLLITVVYSLYLLNKKMDLRAFVAAKTQKKSIN